MKYWPIQNWNRRERKIYNGYVLVYVPEHPKAFLNGFYYEHRLWAERSMGRVLKTYETVHHLDNNKQNNTWANLFICTRQEHDHVR